MLASPIFGTDPKLIARLARETPVADRDIFSDVARAGGLCPTGPGLIASIRQTGGMLSKVLKGSARRHSDRAADDIRTGHQHGYGARAQPDVPASILARATEVIDNRPQNMRSVSAAP